MPDAIAKVLTWVELRTLEPGQRFMFWADDVDHRGPCTLVYKGVGSAIIEGEPHTVTKTFKSRNHRTGQIEERAITQTLSGRSSCALGAQVIPIEVPHA